MYSNLNAQMIQASHADRSQDARLAVHRRELRESRVQAPRRSRQLKRLAAVTAGLVLIGGVGAGEALAAGNARFDSSRRCTTSQAIHSTQASHTRVIDRRFHKRA
jgi:hypothetical protein